MYGVSMKLIDVLEHFLSDCELRGLTLETRSWYRRRLGFFIRKLEQVCQVTELEEITIAHLRKVVLHLSSSKASDNNPRTPTRNKPLSAYTIRGYVRVVKVFFGWCFDEELTSPNPSVRLVLPKAPDYLIPTFTTEHIEKMLATCDLTTPKGFRDYVLLLVLLDTGMRVSELCGLKISDVHDNYVKVFGKGQKEREIGLHPEVSKLLWKYVQKYRPVDSDEDALFLGRGGEPLKPDGVKSILQTVKKATGIEDVRLSAHTFRHTFAKFYLERGGEVFKLAREMGHSTVKVTEIYLKDYRSSEARREHKTYSPIEDLNLPNKRKRKRRGGK